MTLKQKCKLRNLQMADLKKDQEEFEFNNKGRYERIFPLACKLAQQSNQSTQDNSNLSQTDKELASQ